MEDLGNFLTKSWQEHSVAFIFLSAVVGGVVGATFKLIFEFLIPEGLREKREAKAIVARYSAPLARSVCSLSGRIDNLLNMAEYNWFSKSEYYRLSTQYVFCEYLAWREILLGRLSLLRYETSRKNRRLTVLVNNVEKALNNRSYFGDLGFNEIPSDTDLPKFVCKALGELMIRREGEQVECPIEFVEFCKRIRDDQDFAEWLSNLEIFLSDVQKKPENLKWDRLVIIRLSLEALSRFLDPKHEISRGLDRASVKRRFELIQRERARKVFLNDCMTMALPIGVTRIEAMGRSWRTKYFRPKTLRPEWANKDRK